MISEYYSDSELSNLVELNLKKELNITKSENVNNYSVLRSYTHGKMNSLCINFTTTTTIVAYSILFYINNISVEDTYMELYDITNQNGSSIYGSVSDNDSGTGMIKLTNKNLPAGNYQINCTFIAN